MPGPCYSAGWTCGPPGPASKDPILERSAPSAAADQLLAQLVEGYLSRFDANDLLYQFDASRDYNPAPHLERIRAPLIAINSADDQVNPPELGIMEAAIQRLWRGRTILLPTSPQTRGHGTHSLPALWQGHLAELLRTSQ